MYQKMYYLLFNAITDALRLLEKGNIWEAKRILADAQCSAEEVYLSAGDGEEDGRVVEIFRGTGERPAE